MLVDIEQSVKFHVAVLCRYTGCTRQVEKAVKKKNSAWSTDLRYMSSVALALAGLRAFRRISTTDVRDQSFCAKFELLCPSLSDC